MLKFKRIMADTYQAVDADGIKFTVYRVHRHGMWRVYSNGEQIGQRWTLDEAKALANA